MATRHGKLVILGSGPAGYTAAIYAARAGLKPILIQGMQVGGQLSITTEVENYPGFAQPIQGPWLMEQMLGQAQHCGAEIVFDTVAAVDLRRQPFACTGDSGDVFTSDALIVATGALAKWLGLPSEQILQGKGVSACATCDGFFFRGKTVAVIGGGNTAVEEALYLANLAAKVVLVHRRDSLRAEKIMQERLFRNPKIEVVWDHAVDEILGQDAVVGLRIRHVRSGAAREIPLEGVFIAIGHAPTTQLFKGQLDIDADGYILTRPGTVRTSVPGVFAAGDVQDKIYRQAVTAAGTGCMAALEAEKYLAALDDARAAAE
ncbi:MAG: thioredoxin-disulfide reductase [Alphaproteobacteria bacterium]|nr:thioredoxin-disulfide reductase [Alphaproteobacteria bacterium]